MLHSARTGIRARGEGGESYGFNWPTNLWPFNENVR